MSYGWIIDKDVIEDGESNGICGPNGASPELIGRLQSGKGISFKIYDCDDELYYTGRIIGDYTGFEPLDDYGAPNAGATDILYRDDNGHWQPL